MITIWIDDVRPAPSDKYDIALKSTIDVIHYLKTHVRPEANVFLDIDHDAGDYAKLGGDYYKILDWCEAHNYNPVVHIHSMNVVGVQKMRQIIQRNGWEEI